MAYEHEKTAYEEAAGHPIDPARCNELAQRCDALIAEHGADAVAGHEIIYSHEQWKDLLNVLPASAQHGRVTRGDVFEVARAVATGRQKVRDLFTASYIWGQGTTGYGRSRYDRIVSTNANLDSCLNAALRAAHDDLIEAYAQLFGGYAHEGGEGRASAGDDRWARLAHYGPAFFTKFLYFAGGRALILDNVLAGRVHELSGLPNLVDGHGWARSWSPYRYDVYLHWMEQTSAAVTAAGSSTVVTPELLELALFRPTHANESEAAD